MKIGLVEKILIALSVTVVLASFVFANNARTEPDSVVVLKTLGMTCGSCAGKIENALLGKPGVADVRVNVEAAQVIAAYDARVTSPEELADAVTTAGFRSGVVQKLPLEKYRAMTGQNVSGKDQSGKSGCGSSCCN
ncbi:MAG: heavy-metal-associated domain-containing protein [Desulfuromonadales bacterium]|nr:heavy-metal-associated domain-containing protein [Desulfuromonadales bacterium]